MGRLDKKIMDIINENIKSVDLLSEIHNTSIIRTTEGPIQDLRKTELEITSLKGDLDAAMTDILTTSNKYYVNLYMSMLAYYFADNIVSRLYGIEELSREIKMTELGNPVVSAIDSIIETANTLLLGRLTPLTKTAYSDYIAKKVSDLTDIYNTLQKDESDTSLYAVEGLPLTLSAKYNADIDSFQILVMTNSNIKGSELYTQNGTEDFPYIIRSTSDFKDALKMNKRPIYLYLESNIEIDAIDEDIKDSVIEVSGITPLLNLSNINIIGNNKKITVENADIVIGGSISDLMIEKIKIIEEEKNYIYVNYPLMRTSTSGEDDKYSIECNNVEIYFIDDITDNSIKNKQEYDSIKNSSSANSPFEIKGGGKGIRHKGNGVEWFIPKIPDPQFKNEDEILLDITANRTDTDTYYGGSDSGKIKFSYDEKNKIINISELFLESDKILTFSNNIVSKYTTESKDANTISAIIEIVINTFNKGEYKIENLLSDANVARSHLIKLKDRNTKLVNSSYKVISEMITELRDIFTEYTQKDPNFDNSYTLKLLSISDTILGDCQIMEMYPDGSNVIDFKKVFSDGELFKLEATNLILTLSQGILLFESKFEDYQSIHPTNYDHYKSAENSISIFSDILSKLEYVKNNKNLNFRKWTENITDKGSEESRYQLIKLYTGYILGNVLLNADRRSSLGISLVCRKFISKSISYMIKRSLVNNRIVTDNKIEIRLIHSPIILKEEKLIKNNILVKGISNEQIPVAISGLDRSIFLEINSIDCKQIADSFVDSIKGAQEHQLDEILKENRHIFMKVLLQYFFKDNIAANIFNRIKKLRKCFISLQKNFKTLLLEYYFKELIQIIIQQSKKGFMNILSSYMGDLKTIDGPEPTKDLIMDYLEVWFSKNAIDYCNSTDLIKELLPEESSLRNTLLG